MPDRKETLEILTADIDPELYLDGGNINGNRQKQLL